jgi:hypothetical protein
MRSARRSRVFLTFAVLATVQSHAVAGERLEAQSSRCERWLKLTLRSVESSSISRHRDIVVAAVAHACVGVPEALQAAAANYAKVSSEKTKAQVLANGAAAVLKDRCPKIDPLAAAETLVEACPLPGPGEKAHPAVLGQMRAADYLFINALMTSLIAANEYSPTAYRILLEYIISSAQLNENRKSTNRR